MEFFFLFSALKLMVAVSFFPAPVFIFYLGCCACNGVLHCSAANRSLEEKYKLNLPSYPGSAQIVELQTENVGKDVQRL
jgi:hypothetical protein